MKLLLLFRYTSFHVACIINYSFVLCVFVLFLRAAVCFGMVNGRSSYSNKPVQHIGDRALETANGSGKDYSSGQGIGRLFAFLLLLLLFFRLVYCARRTIFGLRFRVCIVCSYGNVDRGQSHGRLCKHSIHEF